MVNLNILSPGFTTPNGSAFLFPLLFNEGRLREAGIRLRVFRAVSPNLLECDVLAIDSKFHRDHWLTGRERVKEELDRFRQSVHSVIWFDTGDSTGNLQVDVFPYVKLYCKSQLLKDRKGYLAPCYGHRVYAEFYHDRFGIEDENPSYSLPVKHRSDLNRLRISWNSGLANYSLKGPFRSSWYQKLPVRPILTYPKTWVAPSKSRSLGSSCRMGLRYDRESVAFQRLQIHQIMKGRVPTAKIPRAAYFSEMCRSKVSVSPFGLGEMTLKDFEAMICGSLLYKPAMEHLETYPNFFESGKTMVSHSWDLADFSDQLSDCLAKYDERVDLAVEGQRRYRHHVGTEAGYQEFVRHLHGLLSDALGQGK